MKKLPVLLLLFLPLPLVAQWSVVPSVTAGVAKYIRNIEDDAYRDSWYVHTTTSGYLTRKSYYDIKPTAMVGGDVSIRYTTRVGLYTSVGIGYSYQTSGYKERGEYSYLDKIGKDELLDLYFPLKVGFYIPDKKFSPIAEVGVKLHTLLKSSYVDLYYRHIYGSDVKRLEEKSMILSVVTGAGVRYSFANGAIEAKVQYNVMQDLYENLSYKYWSSLGVNISYVLNL